MTMRLMLLSVLIAAGPVYAPSRVSANDQPVFGTWAEIFFEHEYPKFARNKAMALGPNEYLYYSYSYASAAEAKSAAVSDCNRGVRKLRKKKKPGGWCLPYAVNNKVVWKGLTPGIPSDHELPLPDLPLRDGQSYGNSKTARAILLALHGCNRPASPPHAIDESWINYFLARDFYVVMPNSFADPRPPELCGNDKWFTDYAVSMEVERLRIAQTKRTLRELKKLHPGKPIYIWGHSAGARTVQSFAPDVKGVIATGDECGFGFLGTVGISSNVPILYIFGENDPYLERFGKTVTEKALKRQCRSKGDRRWVVVDDLGHDIAIWHQNVIDAVSKFIGEKSFSLDYQRTTRELTGPGHTSFMYAYEKSKGYRAFAVAGNGAYGYSYNWDNQMDAIQHALADCTAAAGQPLYAPGGAHTCKIYDSGKM